MVGEGAFAARQPRGTQAVVRTALAGLLGVVVTVLVVATPYVAFGVRSPSTQLVLHTTDALIGLLVAYLLYGRFVRSHRLQDLLLCLGLALLVLGGLTLGRLPGLTAGAASDETLGIWVPVVGRLAGCLLIAAAALVSAERVLHGQSWARRAALLPLVTLVVIAGVLWLLEPFLPPALDVESLPTSARWPLLTGHPVLLLALAVAAASFALAAVTFTVLAARREDALLLWLGPACALGAFARLHYLLFPSIYTDWLYTGDLFRTGCYLLLLVGAAKEIQQYWRDRADLAVLRDRHRVARELHDGLVQELVYLQTEARSLAQVSPRAPRMLAATERAIDEARSAVQALSSTEIAPLAEVVARAATQVARRHGVDLRLGLEPQVLLPPQQQHAIARIVREAVGNAARHGQATCVTITLTREDHRYRLVVRDDGRGFDVAGVTPGADGSGYGLVSMRDRARGLPGTFDLHSGPGEGTIVTVTW